LDFSVVVVSFHFLKRCWPLVSKVSAQVLFLDMWLNKVYTIVARARFLASNNPGERNRGLGRDDDYRCLL
jgi:hypothetical protein